MRVRLFVAVAAAALPFAADARAGSSGPMVRGDGGSAPSVIATANEIAPDSATLLILDRGRTWSLNGGPSRTRQRVALARGSTLTVIDVARWRLVQTAGRPVKMRDGTSMTTKAMTTVVFLKAGVYRFRAAAALSVTVRVR